MQYLKKECADFNQLCLALTLCHVKKMYRFSDQIFGSVFGINGQI